MQREGKGRKMQENGFEQDESEQIEGTVEAITYRNDENGYTVLKFNTDYDIITAVGSFPVLSAGDMLRLFGKFETHKVYGEQFHAFSFEHIRPATAEAILKYLAAGAIKGIGPSTAAKIVARFGENTLEIMEKEPSRLSQIKGISPKKAERIGQEYKNAAGIRETMLHFVGMGISTEESLKIYKRFGNRSVERINENPYELCSDEIGFSFDRADAVARNLGVSSDNDFRVESGIIYILRHNLSNGHTCLPRDKVVSLAAQLLGVSADSADIACDRLCERGKAASFEREQKEFIALYKYFEAESYTAGRMKTMLEYPPIPITAIENQIDAIERVNGIEYDEHQKQAIITALSKGILILAGGPGTGKTTTLKAIITILEQQGMDFFLAAPTGRAAQRMSDLTGYEARTLHRLLDAGRDENGNLIFGKNEQNQLDADAVIVDELSMVDSLLFAALLKAMKLGCRLIMVGDRNQLPAVGAGNVLGDLFDSGKLPVVCLDKIFRQAMQSRIVTNAHLIVGGKSPEYSKKEGDFFLVREENPLRAAKLVADLCARRLPAAYGFDPLKDIQVLCPSRKGETGTAALNERLCELLNPAEFGKDEIRTERANLRVGDKVIQTRNNYDTVWTADDGKQGTGVFNGDIGVLKYIDRAAGVVCVKFGDKTAMYTGSESDDLDKAFAVTVHKSQGSEYDCVIIPTVGIPPQLMFRNLLYTGVTRAKKLLVLVGTEQTVTRMAENDRKTLRYTALSTLLSES